MGSVALSAIGIFAAIILVAWLNFKNYSTFINGPIAGIIIALTSGLGISTFMTEYAASYASTVQGLVITYLAAVIFSEVMKQTGAAQSIAYWVADTIGAKYAATFAVVATTILSIGGMAFGGYFVVYPIGLILCSKANYNKGFMAAACMAGAWSFACTMPGMPSVINNILSGFLGTDPRSAGLITGWGSGIFMIVVDILFLEWLARYWKKKGKVFDSWDLIPEDNGDARKDLPHIGIAIIPVILVLVLFNIVGLAINLSLFIGIVVATLLGIKRLGGNWFKVWSEGAYSCIRPFNGTASMAALGGLIAMTPAFNKVFEIILAANMNPYLVTFIALNVVGMFLGTASGAINTSINAFGSLFQTYVGMGVDAGALHRLIAVSSCGLSGLPHSGGICGVFGAFGTNHKESYMPVLVTCCIVPFIAGLLMVFAMMLGIY